MAYDNVLCSRALSLFIARVIGHYRFVLAREHHVDTDRLQGGTVTSIQRAGSALQASLHFHTVALDGAFLARCPSASQQGVVGVGDDAGRLLRRAGCAVDDELAIERDRGSQTPGYGCDLHAGVRIPAVARSGRLEVVAVVRRWQAIANVLTSLGLSAEGRVLSRCRGPPQGQLAVPLAVAAGDLQRPAA